MIEIGPNLAHFLGDIGGAAAAFLTLYGVFWLIRWGGKR